MHHTLSFFYIEESSIVNKMASPSSTGSNFPRTDLDSPSTNIAPAVIPNPIPPIWAQVGGVRLGRVNRGREKKLSHHLN